MLAYEYQQIETCDIGVVVIFHIHLGEMYAILRQHLLVRLDRLDYATHLKPYGTRLIAHIHPVFEPFEQSEDEQHKHRGHNGYQVKSTPYGHTYGGYDPYAGGSGEPTH